MLGSAHALHRARGLYYACTALLARRYFLADIFFGDHRRAFDEGFLVDSQVVPLSLTQQGSAHQQCILFVAPCDIINQADDEMDPVL